MVSGDEVELPAMSGTDQNSLDLNYWIRKGKERVSSSLRNRNL